MIRMNRLTLPLAVAALLSTKNAVAQGTTTFNIAGGLTLATGDFGNRNETGYNIIGGIGTMQRGTAYGFRAEAFYNEFNQKGVGGVSGTSHAGGATFNIVYDFIAPAPNQPYSVYGIGGGGYYSTRESWYNTGAETNFGWNVGAGVRFPLSGFSAYVEARYHSVSATLGTSFLPISFGLQF